MIHSVPSNMNIINPVNHSSRHRWQRSLAEPHAQVPRPQGCRSELVPLPPPLEVGLGVTDLAHSPAVAEAVLRDKETRQPLLYMVYDSNTSLQQDG